jgi:hypothetical protein
MEKSPLCHRLPRVNYSARFRFGATPNRVHRPHPDEIFASRCRAAALPRCRAASPGSVEAGQTRAHISSRAGRGHEGGCARGAKEISSIMPMQECATGGTRDPTRAEKWSRWRGRNAMRRFARRWDGPCVQSFFRKRAQRVSGDIPRGYGCERRQACRGRAEAGVPSGMHVVGNPLTEDDKLAEHSLL